MKPHCQVGTHPRCLLRSRFRACCLRFGCPARIPPARTRYAKSILLVLRRLRHCDKSFWTFLATASTDNPHKSWCEGRQKCCREGMGFWNSLKSGGSMGRSAGAGLWARYRLCCLQEKMLGQAGPDSAEGWYPALLEERINLGMLFVSAGPFACFAGQGPEASAVAGQEKCCVLAAKQGP